MTLRFGKSLLVSLIMALLLALALAGLHPQGFSSYRFFAFFAPGWLALFSLVLIWQWGGRSRSLAGMMTVAFVLRLGLGIGLSLALPAWGYDTPTQNAGYIFLDALQRDTQAWELAQSDLPIWSAFGQEFFTDQYGGMLAASAGLYRLFTPREHLPWIILLFTAWASAAAVPFLRLASQRWLGDSAASLTAWIYVLYPEAILLGASQMRDPVLLGLICMAFWALTERRMRPYFGLISGIVILAVMAAFSWLVALPTAGVLLVFFWLEISGGLKTSRLKIAGWITLAVVGLAGAAAVAAWLKESALWDAYLTQQGSGWLQSLFSSLPSFLHIPFLVIYGVLQPVLPAAIFDPSLPLASAITTFRSVGWYLALPFLLYAPIAVWKSERSARKSWLVWATLVVWGWIFISSLRAGGDLWDNPRYRTLFLPWIALLIAWAWHTARLKQDLWLGRLWAVMAVFLAFFTEWYVSRLNPSIPQLPFPIMIALIAGLSGLILVGGLAWDRYKARKKAG